MKRFMFAVLAVLFAVTVQAPPPPRPSPRSSRPPRATSPSSTTPTRPWPATSATARASPRPSARWEGQGPRPVPGLPQGRQEGPDQVHRVPQEVAARPPAGPAVAPEAPARPDPGRPGVSPIPGRPAGGEARRNTSSTSPGSRPAGADSSVRPRACGRRRAAGRAGGCRARRSQARSSASKRTTRGRRRSVEERAVEEQPGPRRQGRGAVEQGLAGGGRRHVEHVHAEQEVGGDAAPGGRQQVEVERRQQVGEARPRRARRRCWRGPSAPGRRAAPPSWGKARASASACSPVPLPSSSASPRAGATARTAATRRSRLSSASRAVRFTPHIMPRRGTGARDRRASDGSTPGHRAPRPSPSPRPACAHAARRRLAAPAAGVTAGHRTSATRARWSSWCRTAGRRPAASRIRPRPGSIRFEPPAGHFLADRHAALGDRARRASRSSPTWPACWSRRRATGRSRGRWRRSCPLRPLEGPGLPGWYFAVTDRDLAESKRRRTRTSTAAWCRVPWWPARWCWSSACSTTATGPHRAQVLALVRGASHRPAAAGRPRRRASRPGGRTPTRPPGRCTAPSRWSWRCRGGPGRSSSTSPAGRWPSP